MDKSKDNNEITIKKSGRTIDIKLLNTVMDLDTIYKSLVLLYKLIYIYDIYANNLMPLFIIVFVDGWLIGCTWMKRSWYIVSHKLIIRLYKNIMRSLYPPKMYILNIARLFFLLPYVNNCLYERYRQMNQLFQYFSAVIILRYYNEVIEMKKKQ